LCGVPHAAARRSATYLLPTKLLYPLVGKNFPKFCLTKLTVYRRLLFPALLFERESARQKTCTANCDAQKWHALEEQNIAFCYPANHTLTADDIASGYGALETAKVGTDSPSVLAAERFTSSAADKALTPKWINVQRESGDEQYAVARPRSGHPGHVVVAFADRGVRVLNDHVDKYIFVQMCKPKYPLSDPVFDPSAVNF